MTEDVRVARSRSWLVEALLQLLEERPLAAITVRALCDRAGLSRNTFYRHCSSPEALLRDHLRRELERLTGELETVLADPSANSLCCFFRFWEQRKPLLSVLHRQGLFSLLFDVHLHHARSDLSASLHPPSLAEEEADYYFGWHVVSLCHMLSVWTGRGFAERPEELAALVERMFSPKASRRPANCAEKV